ncbi:MAG: hypothetical protein KAI74_06465 [Kiritimatiellae bacterium]|nr:hypothetical protein [Kiritimatiellia bacterium]
MRNIQIKFCTLLSLIILPSLSIATSAPPNNAEVLISAYFKYNIVKEVKKSAEAITATDTAKTEITDTLNSWSKQQQQQIRASLQKQFNDDAKETFSFFVKNYTAAEKDNDLDYLKTLTARLSNSPAPKSFIQLRNIAINQWLKDDINSAGTLLSEIQTWNDLPSSTRSTLSLQDWLERDKNAPPPTPPEPSLANAEPDLPAFVELDEDEGSAMDIYDKLQSKRRAQVLAESQKYMKQIADERKSAEEEYAQRKSAKATKEAAAVKAQAQKLAAAESEVMEQRKHTWTARFSRLATSVVGGTFSAVTGGVGSAAGAAAAQAIFE